MRPPLTPGKPSPRCQLTAHDPHGSEITGNSDACGHRGVSEGIPNRRLHAVGDRKTELLDQLNHKNHGAPPLKRAEGDHHQRDRLRFNPTPSETKMIYDTTESPANF